MKKLLFSGGILLCSLFSGAQSKTIQILRYNDDNAALKNDTSDINFHRNIKLIDLGGEEAKNNISIGGETRIQYWNVQGINFGELPEARSENESYFLQRFMIHSDLNLGKHFRLFSQLTSNHVQNKKDITPEIDKNILDLSQAFFDVTLGADTKYLLRMGRQEFLYGTEKIMGAREGTNVRQSYAGIKFSLATRGIIGDLFIARPVISKQGIFDDTEDSGELNIGTYWQLKAKEDLNLDFYFIQSTRDNVSYYSDSGDEVRSSLGFAIESRKERFAYNVEITSQFGEVSGKNIRAFQQFASGVLRLSQSGMAPTFGFEEYIISGDKDPEDSKSNTFRAISAKPPLGSYFGFGSSNVVVLKPEISLHPVRKIILKARYMWVWRYSLEDAIYSPSVKSVFFVGSILPDADTKKFYGRGFETSLDYKLNKHFNINFIINHISLQTGRVMRNLSCKGTYKF